MRRHRWQNRGLRTLYFYQQCLYCKIHRREKTGVAGAQVFEYSEDGETFTTRQRVPPCGFSVDSEVLRERAPRPPEELVEAMHDSIHRDTAKLRCFIPLKKLV